MNETADKENMNSLRLRRDVQGYIQIGAIVIVIVIIFYASGLLPRLGYFSTSPTPPVPTDRCHVWEISHVMRQKQCKYNPKYPMSDTQYLAGMKRFKIAVVADLDEERSKIPGKKYEWQSFFKNGFLYKYNDGSYRVEWTDKITLKSNLNENGRGLELSELCAFNRKLYTVDDRTGIVYQILNGLVVPWVILMDGNGKSPKGFKSEWMTVKDGALFIGGLGKEWTTKEGEFINYNPLFVKSIDQYGAVVHHNWTENYLKIRSKVDIKFPGYMIHEAVMWSNAHQRWYFLPRHMSKQKYDDKVDEKRGTNVLISCKADFTDIQVTYVGKLEPTHGFSSFKFVPGTSDNIAVALKTKEVEGNINSYIMAFHVKTGKIMMSEQFIAYEKFEGVEFV